jgi:hypothetical protein
MRVTRAVALVVAAVCLVVAGFALLGSSGYTFCAGHNCRTINCGSAAFPKRLMDLESPDDAANCAGTTPAAPGLAALLLAGLAIGVAVLASRAVQNDMGGRPGGRGGPAGLAGTGAVSMSTTGARNCES